VFRGAWRASLQRHPEEWKLAPLINQHNYDVLNLFFSGNDHRLYGLWYFGIPTLIELNQFSSPFFHLINARLLNAPGTLDLRSYETQSIVNDRVMALLGASYLLSDKKLAERIPVAQQHLFEDTTFTSILYRTRMFRVTR